MNSAQPCPQLLRSYGLPRVNLIPYYDFHHILTVNSFASRVYHELKRPVASVPDRQLSDTFQP